jgi:hypothetical protein
MSGLTDTTTGLTDGTGLYWHDGLDGGTGLNNSTTPVVPEPLYWDVDALFWGADDLFWGV